MGIFKRSVKKISKIEQEALKNIKKLKLRIKKRKQPKKRLKGSSELERGAIREIKKVRRQKMSVKSIEKLNAIFRIYLKEKYSLKSALTYEELIKKIGSKRIPEQLKLDIIALASNFQQIEYENKNCDRKKFNLLIKDLILIIHSN